MVEAGQEPEMPLPPPHLSKLLEQRHSAEVPATTQCSCGRVIAGKTEAEPGRGREGRKGKRPQSSSLPLFGSPSCKEQHGV